MRRWLALTAIVLALAAGGCTVGPSYVRPTVLAPDAYKEVDGWKVAHPMDSLPRGPWWEMFDDPALTALITQVNVSNQNLAVAEAQFRQARALVREARANFFPQVTIGLGVGRAHIPAAIGSAGAGPAQTTSNLTLPLDISWEPDIWGRIRRTVEANRATAQATAADLETSRLSAQAELAQDYFQMRALDAQRQLLQETIAAYERSLELTRDRFDAGVASRADVAQAETQLESTRAQEIDVGVQRAQLEHAIAVLTGHAPAELSLPPAPLTVAPPAIPTGVPSELLQRRPDIAGAERRVAAANAQIGVATAAFYPSVTLSASVGFQSTDISSWLTAPSHFWSVGASIAQTVFDGGFRRAQKDQVLAAYDVTVATYRQSVLTGFEEVEDNLAALRMLEDEARVQDGAVKAAEDALALVMDQYRAGTVSYLNVIVAQATALANRSTATAILGRRMVASALLVKALGGGWDAADLPSNDAVTER